MRSPSWRDSCPTMLEVPDPINWPDSRRIARAKLGGLGPYWRGYSYARTCRGFSIGKTRPAARQPANLKMTGGTASAHGGCRWQARRRQVAEPEGSPDAELPVTLEVAVAFVDRVEKIPDAQEVSLRVPLLKIPNLAIGRPPLRPQTPANRLSSSSRMPNRKSSSAQNRIELSLPETVLPDARHNSTAGMPSTGEIPTCTMRGSGAAAGGDP